MTRPARVRYISWLPAVGAVAGAGGGAMGVVSIPPAALDDTIRIVGLAGLPDRTTLAIAAAVIVGAVCWAVLYLLWGRGGVFDPARRGRPVAPPRRLAHRPEAQPRPRAQWPIAAVDIPAPTPRARPLPADLNQPLSAFDPNSIPSVSFESIRRRGLRPES